MELASQIVATLTESTNMVGPEVHMGIVYNISCGYGVCIYVLCVGICLYRHECEITIQGVAIGMVYMLQLWYLPYYIMLHA